MVMNMTLTNEQKNRFARHIALKELGEEGQIKLLNARVLVVGTGGLGSPVCLYLAAAGVGTIGIIDNDVVDVSNLQRQVIHKTAGVGTPKVESAKEAMLAINPELNINTYHEMFTADNAEEIISGYDFVIECTDNFASKFLVNDACVLLKKPFCTGGILRFEGQVHTWVPGMDKPCYRCIFRIAPPGEASVTCARAGVIGTIPGIIGTLEAMEAIKYITGAGELLTDCILTYDALTNDFTKLPFEKTDDCFVCGKEPVIRSLENYEETLISLYDLYDDDDEDDED